MSASGPSGPLVLFLTEATEFENPVCCKYDPGV